MLKNTGERLILEESWNLMTTLEHLHRYNAVEQLILGKTVLDAACGTGYGTFHLSKTAKQVYGIDISEDAVDYAEKHFQNSNLQYKVMSVAQIDFEDETFDVITSFETIEHITKELQHAFMHQIKKKLKKDGLLIMSTPNDQLLRDLSYGSYVNEFHLCEFTENEYIAFLKQYFRYVKVYYQTVTQASAIVPTGEAAGNGYIFSMEKANHMGRYYLAVCSDNPIESHGSLESAFLPVLEEYFDEAYFTKECMLFADRGNGFCDANKIVRKYVSRDGKHFKCHFSLEDYSDIKALRFDPCEHGGQIRITEAITNRGVISFVPLNASGRENGFDIFKTLDPQYIFQDENVLKSVKHLTICGEIREVPDHTVITAYEVDRQELNRKKQQVSSLNDQLEKLNDTVASQKKENHNLNTVNKELTQKLADLEEQLSVSVNINNELQTAISALEEESRRTAQALDEQAAQIAGLSEQNLKLQNDIMELTNSRSWKITAPLRRLHNSFKK